MQLKSQIDQIRSAKRAYIQPLISTQNNVSRYAVYLDSGNGLQVLWPWLDEDKKRLIPGQIASSNEAWPRFHFRFAGCGYSKTNEIKIALTEINPQIEVKTLSGYTL